MDEKTEQLRDIFVDVADGETVTERQEESRGSLVERGDVGEKLAAVVAKLRERYEFRTDLDDEAYCRLVRAFHEGEDDAEISATLDATEGTVFRARLDCHLLRDADLDAPFDLREAAARRDAGESPAALAADLDVSADELERFLDARAAREQARAANDRYRDEFASILSDADLSGRLTEDVRKTGLQDATEDTEPESNVDF
ncbi:conditioned medium-induced protein 4 [Haloarchaeobius sp. TZWWS8]|uniref:conditioned medium-induced protein 4 n=1 Tax=Haloarchaeobius sp. TZWWS8 TaxID=3446121 RepID=UPI003EC146D4